MKEDEGYNYYVYVRPGQIEYFYNLEKAKEYAEEYDAKVKKMYNAAHGGKCTSLRETLR